MLPIKDASKPLGSATLIFKASSFNTSPFFNCFAATILFPSFSKQEISEFWKTFTGFPRATSKSLIFLTKVSNSLGSKEHLWSEPFWCLSRVMWRSITYKESQL